MSIKPRRCETDGCRTPARWRFSAAWQPRINVCDPHWRDLLRQGAEHRMTHSSQKLEGVAA